MGRLDDETARMQQNTGACGTVINATLYVCIRSFGAVGRILSPSVMLAVVIGDGSKGTAALLTIRTSPELGILRL